MSDPDFPDMSKAALIEVLESYRRREFLFNATESAAHIGHYEWNYEIDGLGNCSEEYARIFGLKVEEAIASLSSWDKLIEFIHQDDREYYQTRAKSLRKTGTLDLEYRIISRDGQVRHIHEFGVIINDDTGNSLGSFGIVQDISGMVAHQRNLEYRDALTQQAEEITDIGYFNFDIETEKYNYISKGFARIHGVSREAYLAKVNSRDDDMSDVHPDDYDRLDEEYRKHRHHDRDIQIDYRIFRADGEVRWIREVGKLLRSTDGSKRQSLGVLQDITAQKQYQNELEYRDALAQHVESITDIGCYIYNEKKEKYLYVSLGYARIYGSSVEDYKAKMQSREDDLSDIHEEDLERVTEEYQLYLDKHEEIAIDYRIYRADGKVRWLRELGSTHKVEDGEIIQTIGVIQDITSQKEHDEQMLNAQAKLERTVDKRTRELAETVTRLQEEITEREKISAELKYLADHDALTGLPSLRLCKDRLERSLIESRRSQLMTGVMFVDLDGFKSINDTYGHEFGDIVLKATADRIKAEIRESDTVARIGGDEFIVIMSHIPDIDSVQRIATNLIEQISQPIQINQQSISVGASIGIALYPDDGSTAEELIRQADRAMYRVKNSGKNNFEFSCSQRLN